MSEQPQTNLSSWKDRLSDFLITAGIYLFIVLPLGALFLYLTWELYLGPMIKGHF